MEKMDQVEKMLAAAALPSTLQWYEISGQAIFPCYGQSGGLSAMYTAVLIHHLRPGFCGDFGMSGSGCHDGPDGKWFRLDFLAGADMAHARLILSSAITALTQE